MGTCSQMHQSSFDSMTACHTGECAVGNMQQRHHIIWGLERLLGGLR